MFVVSVPNQVDRKIREKKVSTRKSLLRAHTEKKNYSDMAYSCPVGLASLGIIQAFPETPPASHTMVSGFSGVTSIRPPLLIQVWLGPIIVQIDPFIWKDETRCFIFVFLSQEEKCYTQRTRFFFLSKLEGM